jgi:hypothetical protein
MKILSRSCRVVFSISYLLVLTSSCQNTQQSSVKTNPAGNMSVLNNSYIGASRTVVGAAIYVPTTVLTEPLGEGAVKQVFATSDIDKCIVLDPLSQPSESKVHTWTKTSSFYEYLSTDSSLDASLEGQASLGATAKVVTKSTDQHTTSFSGAVFEFNAYKQRFDLADDCITGRGDRGALANDLLTDFKALPYPIADPDLKSSWNQYDKFLKRYGSHFVSKLFSGARYRSFVTLKSSSQIKESELTVAACLSAEGLTTAGKASVSGCEGVTSEQKQKISLSDYHVNSVAFGGKETLRNMLASGKAATPELLTEFAETGGSLQDGVRYELLPIWQLLAERADNATQTQIAKSMQAYFEGFLSLTCQQVHGCGCDRIMDKKNKVLLRKFALIDSKQAIFACQTPATGCRNNDDCKFNGTYCQCFGDHCVNRATDKMSAVVNYSTKIKGKNTGVNKSCSFKFDLQCKCQRPDSKRMWDTLWRSDKNT